MTPEAAASRFAALESLGLDSELLGELSASSVPPGTMQALRVLLGTAEELQDPANGSMAYCLAKASTEKYIYAEAEAHGGFDCVSIMPKCARDRPLHGGES